MINEKNIIGLLQSIKYLQAIMSGVCFEYVYRVESEVWYLPLGIGITIAITLFIDAFRRERQQANKIHSKSIN